MKWLVCVYTLCCNLPEVLFSYSLDRWLLEKYLEQLVTFGALGYFLWLLFKFKTAFLVKDTLEWLCTLVIYLKIYLLWELNKHFQNFCFVTDFTWPFQRLKNWLTVSYTNVWFKKVSFCQIVWQRFCLEGKQTTKTLSAYIPFRLFIHWMWMWTLLWLSILLGHSLPQTDFLKSDTKKTCHRFKNCSQIFSS